jgi:hypothetical protein
MEMEEKITLNKKIRSYNGTNSFILSLKKQLASTKATKVEFNGKQLKVLSDKQYEVAQTIISSI